MEACPDQYRSPGDTRGLRDHAGGVRFGPGHPRAADRTRAAARRRLRRHHRVSRVLWSAGARRRRPEAGTHWRRSDLRRPESQWAQRRVPRRPGQADLVPPTPALRRDAGRPAAKAKALSVGGRRVDGEDEERLRAGALHVVPSARGNHDEGAGRRVVLTIADPHASVALEHVENLGAYVLLFGARVGPRRDRHDGGLAALRLLEDPEKLALVTGNRHDLHDTSSISSRARTRATRAVSWLPGRLPWTLSRASGRSSWLRMPGCKSSRSTTPQEPARHASTI